MHTNNILKSLSLIVFAILFLNCKGEKKENNSTEALEATEEIAMDSETEENDEDPKVLEISLSPKSESDVAGTVIFTEESGMVTMVANMTGLSEGAHAIHIHEKADCSSPDGKSAGGHWNPTMQPHGKWGDTKGYHKGDIGNFTSDADGKGSITFATNEWCIGCEDEKANIVGKAIIVHQGKDDYTSQPSGDAGSRVSCGGVIQ